MSGEPANDAQRARLKDAIRSIRRLQDRVAELESAAREPIAIVGIGCRLPGNVTGPDDYWELLEGGVDAIGEVPPERWDAAAWYDPDPDKAGKMYTTAGGFVEGLDLFDADLFGFSAREADKIDPQHRLVLEVAWEALEHAGLPPKGLSGSATGVYLGISAFDHALRLNQLGDAVIDAYSMTGTMLNFAAGRLAYTLGLQGPALSVDTACSSSLTALHLACQALRLDECELALAGGVNAMTTPEQTVAACKTHMLSPKGRCRTFDASADGFVRGEGCGIVVLERLSRAEREGHPVLAVIRGTAVNQDGATSGQTVPNRLAQEAVIRRALQDAGLSPDDIDYVEAHGTATPLGDPIEVRALANVFRGRTAALTIGSVKTNFGHLESAAGVAGLLKVVLALQHESIPPHLHLVTPNPAIDWHAIPIRVATARTPWLAAKRPRRAGVSSFGASGTNAHVVVEEAPAAPAAPAGAARPYHVYCLSAATKASLRSLAARHAAALATVGPLEDACRTAGAGRSHFLHRLAVPGAGADEIRRGLGAFAARKPAANLRSGAAARAPRIAFLFSRRFGEVACAGRDLYGRQREFTQRIDACAELLRPHLECPLPDLMFGDSVERLERPRYAEPALCALQYALAGMWQSFGVMPQALFGIGGGEYVAACLAGALSLEQAIRLALARGTLLESLGDGGGLAAVGAASAIVEDAVAGYGNISIAAVNTADSTVISGTRGDLEKIVRAFAGNGVRARLLNGTRAPQSPWVEPLLDAFSAEAGEIAAVAPRLKLISSIDGAPVSRDRRLDAAYWRRQLSGTVRFDDAMHALAADGCNAFLEPGPGTVTGLARRSLPQARAVWARSLDAARGDWPAICEALAALYVGGAGIDWDAVYDGASQGMLRLPTYSFDRKRHWIDPPPKSPVAGLTAGLDTGHPLLGTRIRSPLEAVQYVTELRADRPRWLADHKVFDRVVVPAAAYLEMLLAAVRGASEAGAEVRDVFIHTPIVLEPGTARGVQTVVEPAGDGSRLCIVSAAAEGGWTQHVSARAQLRTREPQAPGQENLAALAGRISGSVPIDAHYRATAASGISFGPAFRTLAELWRGDGESLGRVRAPNGETLDGHDGCWMHPALLDGCLQVAREALPESVRADRDAALVPMQLGSVSIFGKPEANLVSHAKLTKRTLPAGTYELDLTIVNEDGCRVADLGGLRLARIDRSMLAAAESTDPKSESYRLEWRPKPEQSSRPAGNTNWLVFAYDDPLVEQCIDGLRRAYERVHVVRRGKRLELKHHGDSTVRIAEPSDFRQLVAATVGTGGEPWIVVHAGCAAALPGEPDPDSIRAAHDLYLQSLLHTAQALEASATPPAKLLVVTRAAQGGSTAHGLAGASLWGLGRVLQTELPRLATVLLDVHDPESGPRELVLEAGAADGENQVLYQDGERHVARLRPAGDGRVPGAPVTGPMRLVLETAGIPDSLALRPMKRRTPGRGEVEIEVSAAGLNFRDVLVALGVYQGQAGALGAECAGTITAVGEGVDAFSAGDRVLAFATGAMASHVVTDARLVWPKPALVDDAGAATVPVAFLTAAWGLEHLGRMSPGDRVLIHSAAGGVGMAAVQLAKRAGAEVFGTAGTPEKRRLIQTLGVQHALDSRSLEFAGEIMRLTGGEGVDLVLNSLAGEFIPASLGATKKGGRFIEIGRTDIWSAERVAEARPDIEYHAILLGDVCVSDPALIQELGAGLLAGIAAGELSPLPRRTWPMRRAAAAFRLMARAGHTGKLVLVNDAAAGPDRAPVKSDGAYLVTGGFGGLGIELARWLAGQDAGVIALLGRRGPDSRARSAIDELTALGATVLTITGDVTSETDVRRALAEIVKTGRALRGVFHAAGTLDDGVVTEQTWARMQSVLAAKVSGAIVLQRLTADLPLDLFVLFSSASALFGTGGQAGYAAGNAFLDALARWRRHNGLAALSINWGPWSDAGMFVESGAAGRMGVLDRGFRSLSAARNLAAMHRLLQQQAVEAGVFSMDWAAFRSAHPDGAPLVSELSFATESAAPRRGALAAEIRSAPAARRRQLVQSRVREEVAAVLGNTAASIQTGRGFREQGMDSLMSVELRNRLERLLDCPLVSTLAFDHPSVEVLADYLLREMIAPGDRDQAATAAEPRGDEIASEVAELTDDEAEALLAQELQTMIAADGNG